MPTSGCHLLCSSELKSSLKITAPGIRPQQGDLRLSGPTSGQGAGGGARTCDRRVPADFRVDSLATVPLKPRWLVIP
ncbi:hypothetical protein PoB_005649000 [Plakobranchus ocellatus]|uniref:Uncharacterized protein n=1 Tax=Plakobranchus ocellatus TaxID=259542 RepID=A0AAV4CEV1_9GAST|nr:hypothetical protein PoB_005649000 [Plakobranchus ocellatus]